MTDWEFAQAPEFENTPEFSAAVGDSYIQYHAVYNDTDALKNVDYPSSEAVTRFVLALVNEVYDEADYSVEDQMENIAGVFTPAKVTELATLAAQIDFETVEAAYQKAQDDVDEADEEAEDFDDMMPGFFLELESAEEYANYVKALAEFVQSVDGQNRCLAVFIG